MWYEGANSKIRLDLTKHKLYGREKESQALRELGVRISQPRVSVETCFVHGSSGTGKTALCGHFQKEYASSGFFLSGKCEQYGNFSSPYSAIAQACDSLGNQILSNHANYSDPAREERKVDSLPSSPSEIEHEWQVDGTTSSLAFRGKGTF
jgi:Cdc6-like AAA superfamily ATPase